MFNLRTFSQALTTVFKIFYGSILHFEIYINSRMLNVKFINKSFFTFCLFKQRKMNKQNKTVKFIKVFYLPVGKSCQFHAAHANFILIMLFV